MVRVRAWLWAWLWAGPLGGVRIWLLLRYPVLWRIDPVNYDKIARTLNASRNLRQPERRDDPDGGSEGSRQESARVLHPGGSAGTGDEVREVHPLGWVTSRTYTVPITALQWFRDTSLACAESSQQLLEDSPLLRLGLTRASIVKSVLTCTEAEDSNVSS